VIVAWITYESRAKRDEVNEKVMKDPRLAEVMDPKKFPFDGNRLFWGGFEMIIQK
jgi:uncharacterized protein YbaA (DUF1428 family)